MQERPPVSVAATHHRITATEKSKDSRIRERGKYFECKNVTDCRVPLYRLREFCGSQSNNLTPLTRSAFHTFPPDREITTPNHLPSHVLVNSANRGSPNQPNLIQFNASLIDCVLWPNTLRLTEELIIRFSHYTLAILRHRCSNTNRLRVFVLNDYVTDPSGRNNLVPVVKLDLRSLSACSFDGWSWQPLIESFAYAGILYPINSEI